MKRAFSAAFAFVVLFVTIMTNYSQFTFASAKDEPTKVAILNEGNDVFWEEIEESTDAVYDDYEPDFSNVEITEIEVPQISTGPSRSLTTMSVSFTDAQGEQIRVSGTAPKYSLVKFYKGSSLLGSLESDQY